MPERFISWFTNTSTVNFRKVEKNIPKIIFIFFPPTLNIFCFVEEKNNLFVKFCLCIFESDTVKVIVLPRFLGNW